MKSFAVLLLSACVCAALGFRLANEQSGSAQHFITYVSGTGRAASEIKQQVTIRGEEVKLAMENGMTVVLDYNQMQLVARRSEKERSCIVTSLKNQLIPPFELIEEMSQQAQLEMPQVRLELNLEKSDDQERPNLSPLSEELCGNLNVIVMQQKQVTSARSEETAIARRTVLRPKREVGWGEVVVIIIVIIILL